CSIVFPFTHPSRVNVVSFGAGGAVARDCYFRNNYLWTADNPTPDGVGLSMFGWRGGDVSNNIILVNDFTNTVEPIKALHCHGVLVEDNYIYTPNGSFCSFREASASDPTTHSHTFTVRNNRFVAGWRALSMDADSSIVSGNVIMGGFGNVNNGYIFRVSS